jgi:predicted ATP-binding protein involved in virulence
MKLKNVEITNFRCFESLSLDLDSKLTVLVAKNGQGKSSLLDVIRIGLWSFVSGFDLARNPTNEAGNSISIDDVHTLRMRDRQMVRQLPCEITLTADCEFDWNPIKISEEIKDDWKWQWTRYRDSEAKRSKTKNDGAISSLIKKLASIAQRNARNPNGSDINLPILGYYGTGRLWSQKRLTKDKTINRGKQNQDAFMRLFAYRDCLDPASSYKHFEDWFIWIFECYREEQIRQAEKGALHENNPKWKETILVVQQAINDVLEPETGWRDLEYSVSDEKSLILNNPDYGKLKVEQLSDGIRGILAMVGDIAYRCVKLNWHLGANAAKETHGVVMIDEIEMHLHPAWQQSILGNLCKAFPNIQFIATTHSPQVLSTVPSHQIRILDEGKVHSANAGTQGAEASRILKQIFGVDPRPQNDPNTRLLNDYLDLVYKDKWNNAEAKEKRVKLNEIYQDNEPALTAADLYIENRQWELEIEENQ